MANKKNFHRRRKYAAIINALGDKDLAYRGREWSYKRINEELAVNIPKDNTEIEIISNIKTVEKKPIKLVKEVKKDKTKLKKKTKPKKISSSKRNFHRRRKYAAIINFWGDHKKAYEARDWPYKRIKAELGVDIPQDNSEIKINNPNRKKSKTQFKTFTTIKSEVKNVDTKEAVKASKKYSSRSAIASIKKEKRFKQWSFWSKNENGMPKELEDRVKRLNKRFGKPLREDGEENEFGWILVYNQYIFGGTMKSWIEKTKFNRWNSNIYSTEEVL